MDFLLSGWRGRQYAGNANAAAAEADAEAEAEAEAVQKHQNQMSAELKGKGFPKRSAKLCLNPLYRAMNAGAFPTVSCAQKELGGSYYVVKGILQELQYKAKMSPWSPVSADMPKQEEVREIESLAQVEENSNSQVSVHASTQTDSEATYDADLPGQEDVGEIESLTQCEENSISEVSADAGVQNDSEETYDTDLPGQEEVGEIESLTGVEDNSTYRVSAYASGRHLEANEEAQASSSVEILSEEVITRGSDSDLVATQNLDELSNSKEEAKQNLSGSISKECQLSEERFEVVSYPFGKSENSERAEAEADKQDFVAKEKDLPIGEANRASLPSFGDIQDMKKQEDALEDLPDYDDLKCKREKYEEIPQPDKLPKDLPGRQADDAEPSSKSTQWNMKSFANGIISIFRKL
ncbi:hydroxyproline-rich glycoprotein family protein [Prunus dulcis]|uniref:Hydroxyproline-rich glycoprotein family protein n=1 Tax=Prunus dulcis TaxID=3755 RepID=A0A4Y1RYL6_PRUDU|nr:hydroxyproline-rich glycoprotein family protein [Prunus dulcis]